MMDNSRKWGREKEELLHKLREVDGAGYANRQVRRAAPPLCQSPATGTLLEPKIETYCLQRTGSDRNRTVCTYAE